MVYAVQIAITHYLNIPYQNFTEKAIAGLGFLNTLDTKKQAVKEDIIYVNNIIRITDTSLFICLYDLDRWISPTGTVDKKMTFKVCSDEPNKKVIKDGRFFDKSYGHDYILQRKLCIAIAKINVVIMRNLAIYSKDFPIQGEMTLN